MEVLVHRLSRTAFDLSNGGIHLCMIQEAQVFESETSGMTGMVVMEINLDGQHSMAISRKQSVQDSGAVFWCACCAFLVKGIK